MATMKRRIVYLTDEQWADLQAQARGERTTISNLIRHGMALIPPTGLADQSPVEFHAPRRIETTNSATWEMDLGDGTNRHAHGDYIGRPDDCPHCAHPIQTERWDARPVRAVPKR